MCSACVTLYKLELLSVEIEGDKYCNHMWLSEERDLEPLLFFPFFFSFFFFKCHILYYFSSPFRSLIPSLETPAKAKKKGNEDDLQVTYSSEDREHDRIDVSL